MNFSYISGIFLLFPSLIFLANFGIGIGIDFEYGVDKGDS